MKTFSVGLQALIDANPQKLAVCWVVRVGDGTFIRGTAHDKSITITSVQAAFASRDLEGTYTAQANIVGSDVRSSADLAVDNLEVGGAIPTGSVTDLTVTQIESGVLDMALATVFVVPWASPDSGVIIVKHGPLGEITRTAEGEYRTEVRGLTQYLQQQIGRTFGELCDVRVFGDARCGFNLAGATRTGTVSSVTSRTVFAFTLSGGAPATGYFNGGLLTFTSGDNDTFAREVKTATYAAGTLTVTLYEETPEDVAVSDTLTISPGCNRTWETCKTTHSNGINFRGHGRLTPGVQAMLKGNT